MQLSGTSFAAPVVAGAAAMLMAQHPTWTPDQVKGALMVTSTPEPKAPKGSLGVGEINIAAARGRLKNPPNPNAGLNKYVVGLADGTRAFDASAWQKAAKANKAWNAVAWSDVAWSDAAWSSVAWSDAAWADAAWASVAWGDAAWSDVAWSDAAWSDAAWADNAADPSVGDAADATIADRTRLSPSSASSTPRATRSSRSAPRRDCRDGAGHGHARSAASVAAADLP